MIQADVFLFGDIPEICAINYDFGHYSFFSTNKKRIGDKYILRRGKRKIVINSGELGMPNYHDFDVLLGILKLFEINRNSISDVGYLSDNYQYEKEVLKSIKISGRDLCYMVGNAYSQDALAEIRIKMKRLCSTEVYDYNDDSLIGHYHFVRDVVFDIHSFKNANASISILMDSEMLDICTKDRRYLVKYRVIQTLASLVQKGIYLYLSCNKSKILLEARMYKFLFRLDHPDHPKKLKADYGTSDKCASDIIIHSQKVNLIYAKEMKKYNSAARECKRQINDALTGLKEKGVIHNYYYVDGRKNKPTTERRYWIVEKSAPQAKQAKPPVSEDAAGVADDDSIPF